MTEWLERVIAQLKTLPADEQDAIAARLLAKSEDEQTWKAQFESTTDEQWDRIADRVRQELLLVISCLLPRYFQLTRSHKSNRLERN